MNNDKPAKGYYSILQYIHNLERSEGVNVGVLLFCHNKNFLELQTTANLKRLKTFFGGDNIDSKRLKIALDAFSERIELVQQNLNIDTLTHFINTRANNLRLTSLRSIKVFNPKQDLLNLFEELVNEHRQIQPRLLITKPEMIRLFEQIVKLKNVEAKIKRNVEIESTLLAKKMKFPFSFQNGKLNLIEPVEFAATTLDGNIKHAGQIAFEADIFAKEAKSIKLNIIGSFRQEQTDTVSYIKNILNKYDVSLYTPQNLEILVNEIETSAH